MTKREPIPSHTTVLVLQALAAGRHHGFDIMDATELASGTVYPILRRLDRDGLATSTWEDVEIARQRQRPPRRYYDITSAGLHVLETAASRYRALARGTARAARNPKPALGTS